MTKPRVLMATSEIAGYMGASLRALAKEAEIAIWSCKRTAFELPGVRYLDYESVPTVEALFEALGDWRPELYLCGGWCMARVCAPC